MNRRNITVVALIYALALIALVAAAVILTGLWPGDKTANRPLAAANDIALTPQVAAIPTLRPIWPAAGTSSDTSRPGPAPTAIHTPVPSPAFPASHEAATGTSIASAGQPGGKATDPGGLPPPTQSTSAVPTAMTAGATPSRQAMASPVVAQAPQVPAVASATPAAPGEPFIVTMTPQPRQVGSDSPQPPATYVVATQTTPTAIPPTMISPTAIPETAVPATEVPSQGTGQISGRLLLDGSPARVPVTLTLETQAHEIVDYVTVSDGGYFTFKDVASSAGGYNLVFSQIDNPMVRSQRLASWAWVGPIRVQDSTAVGLEDLDVALKGLGLVAPAADGKPQALPIVFQWSAYPGATQYWLSLSYGVQENIWTSAFLQETQAQWDGRLAGGGALSTTEAYWWGVGAQRPLGPYILTVFTNLSRFSIQT